MASTITREPPVYFGPPLKAQERAELRSPARVTRLPPGPNYFMLTARSCRGIGSASMVPGIDISTLRPDEPEDEQDTDE